MSTPEFKQYATSFAWSAVFISYVMKKSNVYFPYAGKHTTYSQKIKKGGYPWTVLNPKTTQLQRGDIIVQNREGNILNFETKDWVGSSHGDIIIEVTNNQAIGIGGNVNQSVSKSKFTLYNKILANNIFFVVLRPNNSEDVISFNAIEEYNIFDNRKEWDDSVALILYNYYKAGGLNPPHPGASQPFLASENFWDPLLKLIRKVEAIPTTSKTTEYDSVVKEKKAIVGLSSLTINEAIKKIKNQYPKSNNIGAYQFNMDSLEGWTKGAGLLMDDLFNKQNQDKIAIYLIETVRSGKKWLNPPNNLSTVDFMLNLSMEWAGLPCPINTTNVNGAKINKGESYWAGTSTNNANASLYEFNKIMNLLKLKIEGIVVIEEEDISKGLLPISTTEENPFGSNRDNIILNEDQYLQYIQD
jgi:hypothetical protein